MSYPSVADIGTDHGYLPIYLSQKGAVTKAIACDVNTGPLERAKKNIKEAGMESRILTRLGSGLSPILPGEAETVVLAGMGGMLIIELLKNSPEVIKTVKQIVLQPQQDIEKVRRFLHDIHFQVKDEALLWEEGKFYIAIQAEPGEERYEKDVYYYFGKPLLEKRHDLLPIYIESKKETLLGILEHLQHQQSKPAERRKQDIIKELNLLEEGFNWLSQR